LLDTYVAGQMGGTGQRFDPALATGLVRKGWRVIMAGGLTPENVGEVVAKVRPHAVDVSSGVESAPGKKDHAKIRQFTAAVRAADEAYRDGR
jgi:phosphoribosylanthranilate isomerase